MVAVGSMVGLGWQLPGAQAHGPQCHGSYGTGMAPIPVGSGWGLGALLIQCHGLWAQLLMAAITSHHQGMIA